MNLGNVQRCPVNGIELFNGGISAHVNYARRVTSRSAHTEDLVILLSEIDVTVAYTAPPSVGEVVELNGRSSLTLFRHDLGGTGAKIQQTPKGRE